MFDALTLPELNRLYAKIAHAATACTTEAVHLARIRGDIRAYLYGPGTYEQMAGLAGDIGELLGELRHAQLTASGRMLA